MVVLSSINVRRLLWGLVVVVVVVVDEVEVDVDVVLSHPLQVLAHFVISATRLSHKPCF